MEQHRSTLPPPRDGYTLREFATRWQGSPRTIERAIARGEIRPFTSGAAFAFRRVRPSAGAMVTRESTAEVAEAHGIHIKTLRHMIERGELRVIRFGAAVRIPRA